LVLVHDVEHRHELAVDVDRRAVRPGLPAAVMIIGPMRPEFVSRTSSVCERYIHITELPSGGPGPARGGTFHV